MEKIMSLFALIYLFHTVPDHGRKPTKTNW